MKYKVLLFDFDGTLCDSQTRSLQIINILADEFKFKKLTSDELEMLKNVPLREALTQMRIPMIRLPAIVYRARTKFFEEIDTLRPVEGISKILLNLKQMGYQLGIVTSNSRSNVERFLTHHSLPEIDFVRGDSSMFGKAKVLKRLLRDLRISPSDTIYIGDETRDIEAAKSVKMKIISVTWGYNSKALLEKNSPDFLVESPDELPGILRRTETHL